MVRDLFEQYVNPGEPVVRRAQNAPTDERSQEARYGSTSTLAGGPHLLRSGSPKSEFSGPLENK